MYETLFLIYECHEEGGYLMNEEPYEYGLKTEEVPTNEEIKNVIFQACEIERIPNTDILIDFTTTKNGEFFNHDELEFNLNIIRTKELSDYICWEKCNLSPVYKVDKKKSKIKLLEFLEEENRYEETDY